jgi:hypothetical protein
MQKDLLRFGHGNAKLDEAVFTFSLSAGHFCPFAGACLARANRKDGHVTDGPDTEFRCYEASVESRYPSVRRSRWHNASLLSGRNRQEMVELILASLSPWAGFVRLHTGGDFFSQDYFDAWLEVALRRDRTVFYAYTKSLPFWVKRLKAIGNSHEPGKVANLILTASWGGTEDRLITKHGLRSARVVYREAEAAELGLEIDHDDRHAAQHGPDFALLIHGMQPAGSVAAKAVQALREQGIYGYGRSKRHSLTLIQETEYATHRS